MPKKAVKKASKGKKVVSKKAARPSKAAPKKAKAAKKVAKSMPKTPKKPKSQNLDTAGIYEETTITCPGCGRVSKVIKLSGVSTEGLICQRCAKGDIELEDMDF